MSAGLALKWGKARWNYDAEWMLAKVMAPSVAMEHMHLPFVLNWLGVVGLIFGGCCSNVSCCCYDLWPLETDMA